MIHQHLHYLMTAEIVGCFWREYHSNYKFNDYWFEHSCNNDVFLISKTPMITYPDAVEDLVYDGYLDVEMNEKNRVCFFITEKGSKYLNKIQQQFCHL